MFIKLLALMNVPKSEFLLQNGLGRIIINWMLDLIQGEEKDVSHAATQLQSVTTLTMIQYPLITRARHGRI